jgi:hypothetical protein
VVGLGKWFSTREDEQRGKTLSAPFSEFLWVAADTVVPLDQREFAPEILDDTADCARDRIADPLKAGLDSR